MFVQTIIDGDLIEKNGNAGKESHAMPFLVPNIWN